MKPTHTLETCSAKAQLLSMQKLNAGETFHVIKSDAHFIVNDTRPNTADKHAQFQSREYWIVRKSNYNSMQGNIVCSFRNGKKQVNNAPKKKLDATQGKIDLK